MLIFSESANTWLTQSNPVLHNGTAVAGLYGLKHTSGMGICGVRFPGCKKVPDSYRSPEIRELQFMTEDEKRKHDLKKDAIMLTAHKILNTSKL